MFRLTAKCPHVVLAFALLVLAGCYASERRQTVARSSSNATVASNVTNQSRDVVDQELAQPAEAAAEPTPATEPPPDQVAAAPVPAAADASPSPPPREAVILGSPELTAGIPGDGPLTEEQIAAWLDDPRNHAVLDVQLPEGLAVGVAQMFIPEDNPMTRAKIELGRQLYFDPRLSVDGTISCASCHHPDEGYARNMPFGVGVRGQEGGRNSPASYNRILSQAQFWDGRAASLEEQAKGPIANPIEMGNTHEACVAALGQIEGYRMQFARIFPDEGVNIDSVAKAIAAFERAIVTGPAPYDYYEIVRAFQMQYDEEELAALKEEAPELFRKHQAAVEKSAPMSESARRGREIFFTAKGGCTACHVGANFTDEKYHNLGVGMDKPHPDLGRYEITQEDKDRGAFKTPGLRNVALTAPYMHDGSQATLEEVVEFYAKGGHPNPHLSENVKKLDLTDQEKKDLVAFMKEGLTSAFPVVETGRLPQ